ncbi:related to multidrug resistant [Lecanosticta acicola]|uniref:Cercosporin MFS transporter CTB4 n=1 Tax=Lecanosticta acicola TaxID=111012 RepID=A0AAI9EDA2_9PEZI|nr:related to multidrug resistant [Lecanosticta acicola]
MATLQTSEKPKLVVEPSESKDTDEKGSSTDKSSQSSEDEEKRFLASGFVTMMSGAMIAPALPELSRDLDMSEATAGLALSVFILAFAFGPMILGPLSEIYGRRPVWLISGLWYSVFNIMCGFSHNKGTMIAGRILSGFGGSVDFVISYPVLYDIWRPEERGKSIAINSVLPMLGPALGPFLGGVLTQAAGWRWLFWWAAIFNGVLVFVAIFLFPETSSAKILGNKARRLQKQTGAPYHTEYHAADSKLSEKLYVSLKRPVKMLFLQPILPLVSIYMSYNFGVLYAFLSTNSLLYTEKYHEDTLTSGLHYLALAVGYTIAQQGGGRLMDHMYKLLKKRHGGDAAVPEWRVPNMIPGSVLIPVGLLWYGWSAEARLHWIMPDIGAAIFGCGFILSTVAMLSYLLDSLQKYTASASAAGQLMRMIAGFAFPIFAPAMLNKLGWGWTNTVFALIAIVLGIPGPLILWRYGAKIRAIGKAL